VDSRDRCARLRPSRPVGRSIKRESVVRESFCSATGASEPGRWPRAREIDYYCYVRYTVPCYRIMSLLFKNHAPELHVLQSITIM